MGVFIEPPFWALPYGRVPAPHGVSVRVTPAATDPLMTLPLAKKYARLAMTDTSLDTILPGMLIAARDKVQLDTGIVLLAETYDVFFDSLPTDRTPIALPWRPIQSITSVKSIDTAGVTQTLAVSNYELDASSEAARPARLALSIAGAWPTDVRPFQPYVIRLVAGWLEADVAKVPKALIHAIGLVFDVYANQGGSLDAYEDVIAPYKLVTVA